jgi:hypothetical protein
MEIMTRGQFESLESGRFPLRVDFRLRTVALRCSERTAPVLWSADFVRQLSWALGRERCGLASRMQTIRRSLRHMLSCRCP